MPNTESVTIGVSVEVILQNEIIAVVEKINQDYGLQIDGIEFSWAYDKDGTDKVARCETRSSYNLVG